MWFQVPKVPSHKKEMITPYRKRTAASSSMTPGKKKIRRKLVVPTRRFGNPVGFPLKFAIVHRYAQTQTINCTSGVQGGQFYSCNSLYDPDVTGTGHQPMYFDQMCTLYDHYCVLGSKITWTISQNNNSGVPVNCAVAIDDDATLGSSTPGSVAEHKSSPGLRVAVPNAGVVTFTQKWSAKKTFGAAPLANTSLQGTSTSSPSENSHFILVVQPIDASSTVTVYVSAVIEYFTIWKELRDVTPS